MAAVLAVTTALALGGGAHAAPIALGGSAHAASAKPAAAAARPAHPVVFGTEASNKHLAEVRAEEELESVRLPPSAQSVADAPAPILEEALGTRGEPNLVQRWKYFVAPGTVAGTLAWFEAHPPAGSRVGSINRRGGPEAASSIWFEVGAHSRRVDGPSVIPIVARLPGHRVGIRLEVQQVWKTPHPAAAKVPPAARLLYVSRQVGRRAPKWQVIRSARRVRHFAHLIDQLPAAQPQVIYGCLEFPEVERVQVRMLFRARKGGPPLAEAAEQMPPEICESMTLKVAGDTRTFSLEGGPRVIEALRR